MGSPMSILTQDSADTRQRLLAAAGAVFAAKGFKPATVREICQQAQVNLAAVNYHFGDKERLYIESVKLAHRRRVEQAPLPNWPPGTPPQQRLHDFVHTLLLRMLIEPDEQWQAQLMMREINEPTSACAELVRDYMRPHFEILQGILAELLPSDVPAEKRHLIAFGIVGQCLYFRIGKPLISHMVPANEHAGYTPDRLARHITDSTLASLDVRNEGGRA
jgi:AcrR family transcriptional regulator